MNNGKNRAPAVLLAVMLILLTLPLPQLALAEPGATGGPVGGGTCGEEGGNVNWTLDAAGTLTVSGEGRMEDYGMVSDRFTHAPWETLDVRNVVILDGVTYVGQDAFARSGAQTVSIPASVTGIGAGALSGSDLKTVRVDPGNGRYMTDESGVLYDIEAAALLRIPPKSEIGEYSVREGTETVASGALDGCGSLTAVSVPDSVKELGRGLFRDCAALERVSLGAGLEEIGYGLFAYCSELKEVKLSNGPKTIGFDAFTGCEALQKIEIPGSVETIGSSAFSDCTALREVRIGEGVKTIGYRAFSGCTALRSVTVPASVAEIGAGAFQDAASLTEIYYGGTEAQWDAVACDAETKKQLGGVTVRFGSAPAGLTDAGAPPAGPDEPATVVLGDADLDGKVQAKDARAILRHAAKLELLTDAKALFAADADRDGKIRSSDARLALRVASKLEEAAETEYVPAQPPEQGTATFDG